MRSHRTVFLRYISAVEHESDQFLIKSSSYIAWLVLLISAPTSLTFGYFVYLVIDSEYFIWKNDYFHVTKPFYEHYIHADTLWLTVTMAIACLITFTVGLISFWRIGTHWTASAPSNNLIEIRKSNWFSQHTVQVPAEDAAIRVGRYLNRLYKTKTIGWIDVILVVGKHAFLVDYALLPKDADELARRLSKKLGQELEQFDDASLLYLLPYFVFN